MTTKSTKKAAPKKAAKATRKNAKPNSKAKAPATAKAATEIAAKPVAPRPRDPRLPRPGAVLTRTFQGKEIKVDVLDAGFRHDGKVWRSLSAIAKAVSGTSWNGFLFFGIQKRQAKPRAEKTTPVATAETK